MLPSYFDYILVYLRQKARLGPELSPKFLSTLSPNPARTRLEKPGPTYNSVPRYIGLKLSTFCPFSTSKILVTWPGAPKLGLHKAFIITHIVCKFQLCTPSSFWVIGELLNIQVKNRLFLRFLVSQFTITGPRIPKIRTHNAFVNSHVEFKFQLSRFYRLLAMSKSILILQKSRTKTKVLRAHAKS